MDVQVFERLADSRRLAVEMQISLDFAPVAGQHGTLGTLLCLLRVYRISGLTYDHVYRTYSMLALRVVASAAQVPSI